MWSLDRKVATAMKVRKSPIIISGFKKHTRRKGNIRLSVRGFRTSKQTNIIYTSCKSYLPIGLLPSFGLCRSSVSATKRIAAILAHLRMLKHVQMPTLFRASKLLPFALHFACKVRYVRHVPSSVVRNRFGVPSVRLLFASIPSRLQTAANWLKSAS